MYLIIGFCVIFQAAIGEEAICHPKAPSTLGEFCRDKCDAHLQCIENRCSCPDGYNLTISGSKQVCQKECAANEIVVQKAEINFCRNKCGKDEVQIEMACLPIALLGDNCTADGQCVSLFTQCFNGTCECLADFQISVDNYCIPNKFSCRFGEPLLDPNSEIIPCEIKAANITQEPVDSCPSASYCQVYMPYAKSIGQQGHCCPDLNQECPVGNALNLTVSDCPSECPSDTHYCYGTVCCPQPCPPDFFFHYDRCYPYVELRQQCYLDQQCERHIGRCIQEECRCPWRSIESPDGRCEPRCSANELRIGDVCVQRHNLGDSCERDALCPEGASCLNGQCRCHCHLTHVGGNLCAIPPRCPNPVKPGGSLITGPGEAMKEPRLCRLPHAVDATYSKLANISDSCRDGEYCAKYLAAHRIGVCCVLPDPTCPDGSSVDPTGFDCDPEELFGCGDSRFCYRHLSPADDTSVAHVCCPRPITYILPGVPDAIVNQVE